MSPTPLDQDSLSADAKLSSTKPSSTSKASALAISASDDSVHSPLTFSQALTITAGMAGLIGLLSGGFIRFSLAHSPTTRALSPLQTFPSLPNGSSQPLLEPSEASSTPLTSPLGPTPVEDWQTSSEPAWESNVDDADSFRSESFTDLSATTEPVWESSELASNELVGGIKDAAPDFDTFADRSEGRARSVDVDPLKALSNGPLLRQPVMEDAVPRDMGAESSAIETDG